MLDLSLSNENRTVYVNVGADKRVRALIVYSDGHRVNVSYPRMLMEEKLGRPLEPYNVYIYMVNRSRLEVILMLNVD